MRDPNPELLCMPPGRAGGIAVAGPSMGPHRDGEKTRSAVRPASLVPTTVDSDAVVPTDVPAEHHARADPRIRQTSTASPAEPGEFPTG
jgi:hypothetical protein